MKSSLLWTMSEIGNSGGTDLYRSSRIQLPSWHHVSLLYKDTLYCTRKILNLSKTAKHIKKMVVFLYKNGFTLFSNHFFFSAKISAPLSKEKKSSLKSARAFLHYIHLCSCLVLVMLFTLPSLNSCSY